MEKEKLENPTLTLKLSAILRQPWNRDLLEESLVQETIRKLRGITDPVSSRASLSSESQTVTSLVQSTLA